MHWNHRIHLTLASLLVVMLFVSLATLSGAASGPLASIPPAQVTAEPFTVWLPLIARSYPWQSPFGVETNQSTTGTLLTRAEELGVGWVRLHRVSWRAIQPNEGGPYDWSGLSSFEDELRALRQAGLTPIVIVHHSPRWATINEPFETDCGAIRADKFDAFRDFMVALVNRYKGAEFNVHYWELGNEPDVDPTLVPADYVFGCWGDIDDPYYGGRRYGEMLKVVTPAIKAADPNAKVLIGGLLLASPNSDPAQGKPEWFLKGILEAGAPPYDYFDVVPYHAYPSYTGLDIDYDNEIASPWKDMGGWTLGKARYLQQTMAEYGVEKPLFLDETALGCNDDWYACDPPPAKFFEAQADYIARTFSRALSEDVRVFVWYTLDGPGWRDGGLLDGSQNPRPAYLAYQHLALRLQNSRFAQAVDYGSGVEAYGFTRGAERIHVLWSTDAMSDTISTPQAGFLAAYDRDGVPLTPTPVGSDYQFEVGFSPIYLELSQ